MFKLKPGNVFQKMQKMNKKQAYTIGGIVVALFIALLTLASFMGDAEETSFDGMNTRGYDLAQMPFVNDEAEKYLLASKYPDMQGNNSTMLYSSSEKKDRQEEDANQAEEKAAEDGAKEAQNGADSSAATSHGYGGRGGAGTPTQVGQLGNASMGHSGGSGVSATWGAPRGDFSPYKSQDKGSEIPTTQLKNQDAKRALAQFAQTSRAAAGLRDGKSANAKRALMGGRITGSEAFTDSGVDLSKTGGLALDTNAPVTSADLSNLGDKVAEKAKQAEKKKEEEKQSLGDRLLEQFLSGMVQMGVQAVGNLFDRGIDSLFASREAYTARRGEERKALDALGKMSPKELSELEKNDPKTYTALSKSYKAVMGDTEYDTWMAGDGNTPFMSYKPEKRSSWLNNIRENSSKVVIPTQDDGNTWQLGPNVASKKEDATAAVWGNRGNRRRTVTPDTIDYSVLRKDDKKDKDKKKDGEEKDDDKEDK